MMRKRIITIAAAALPLATLQIGSYAAGECDDASSSASATAIEVDGVLVISDTNADTDCDGTADATSIALFGETIVGGSQAGAGSDSGSLLTEGDESLGSISVAPWDAEVTDSSSTSNASLLEASATDPDMLSVGLLRSRSHADENGAMASTTGATVTIDGTTITLLHSEATDTGSGAYLVGIDDTYLFTDEDASAMCDVDLDPVARLLCLDAQKREAIGPDGSPQDPGNEAVVARLGVVDDAVTGTLFDTGAGISPAANPTPNPGPNPAPVPPPAPTPVPEPRTDPLPTTGINLLLGGLLGLGSLGVGERMRRFRRS